MGKWNPAEGNPAVGRALGAVRAVTALSGLRVVLTLDQLAEYVDEPLSSLDAGLRNGPMAATQVERVVQGTYVGYRHPDAAWTTLPTRYAAAPEATEFARWFADWLAAATPDHRQAAHATAKAVALAARATGKIALAARIDATFRRARRPGQAGRVRREVRAHLPTRATAGILAGTGLLLVGAVAGVAVLTESGAAASPAQAKPPTSTTVSAIPASPAAALATASPAHSGSAAAPAKPAAGTVQPTSAASAGPTPVLAVFNQTGAGRASGTSTGASPGGGPTNSSSPAESSPASTTSITTTPTTATTTTTSTTSTSNSHASASKGPVATSTTTSAQSTPGCVNLLGVVSVCL